MTDDRSLERAARSWLEEGPTRAPDRVVQAALDRIEATPQDRVWPRPFGGRSIERVYRVATGFAVVAALLFGAMLLGQRSPGPGPAMSPSPSPTSSAGTSPSAPPQSSSSFDAGAPAVLTRTFESPRNGYSALIDRPVRRCLATTSPRRDGRSMAGRFQRRVLSRAADELARRGDRHGDGPDRRGRMRFPGCPARKGRPAIRCRCHLRGTRLQLHDGRSGHPRRFRGCPGHRHPRPRVGGHVAGLPVMPTRSSP